MHRVDADDRALGGHPCLALDAPVERRAGIIGGTVHHKGRVGFFGSQQLDDILRPLPCGAEEVGILIIADDADVLFPARDIARGNGDGGEIIILIRYDRVGIVQQIIPIARLGRGDLLRRFEEALRLFIIFQVFICDLDDQSVVVRHDLRHQVQIGIVQLSYGIIFIRIVVPRRVLDVVQRRFLIVDRNAVRIILFFIPVVDHGLDGDVVALVPAPALGSILRLNDLDLAAIVILGNPEIEVIGS